MICDICKKKINTGFMPKGIGTATYCKLCLKDSFDRWGYKDGKLVNLTELAVQEVLATGRGAFINSY